MESEDIKNNTYVVMHNGYDTGDEIVGIYSNLDAAYDCADADGDAYVEVYEVAEAWTMPPREYTYSIDLNPDMTFDEVMARMKCDHDPINIFTEDGVKQAMCFRKRTKITTLTTATNRRDAAKQVLQMFSDVLHYQSKIVGSGIEQDKWYGWPFPTPLTTKPPRKMTQFERDLYACMFHGSETGSDGQLFDGVMSMVQKDAETSQLGPE